MSLTEVTLLLPQKTIDALNAVVDACNFAHTSRNGATTNGLLDLEKLMTMLAEDAALSYTRPGSWEGAAMQSLLDSHGYF